MVPQDAVTEAVQAVSQKTRLFIRLVRQWDSIFDNLIASAAVHIVHFVHMWKSDKFTA